MTNFAQTFDIPEHDSPETFSVSTQTDFKPVATKTTTSAVTTTRKSKNSNQDQDSHLLATIRGMRVDLAIKEKAMQRLTRELDECKKNVKKLEKEKSGIF